MGRRRRRLLLAGALLGVGALLGAGALRSLRHLRPGPSAPPPARPAGGGLYLFNGCEVHDAGWHTVATYPGDFCRYYPTGEILSFVTEVGLVLMTKDLGLVWRAPEHKVHHAVRMLPSGAFYFLDSHWGHRYKGTPLRFDVLVKMSRGGEILSQWCTYDYLESIQRSLPFRHPAEDNPRGVWDDAKLEHYGNGEYFHLNYVDVLPRNPNEQAGRAFAAGNLLLSFPLFQTLAILDPTTYEILWTHTLDAREAEFGQHCASMLPTGNILMFVNSLRGREPGQRHSAIVELDPVTRKIVWRYVATPPQAFFSEQLGCVQRLEDGNTLVTVGAPLPSRQKPYVFVVTPKGEVVSRYTVQRSSAFYQEDRQLLQVSWVPRRALAPHLPITAR